MFGSRSDVVFPLPGGQTIRCSVGVPVRASFSIARSPLVALSIARKPIPHRAPKAILGLQMLPLIAVTHSGVHVPFGLSSVTTASENS